MKKIQYGKFCVAILLGITMYGSGTVNTQAAVKTIIKDNHHSKIIRHNGYDKSGRQMAYQEAVAENATVSVSSVAASSAAVIATGHTASYLGIKDSMDYNAIATASSAIAYPYHDLLETRTISGSSIIYGTAELIAPGIALTAGHVATGSSASTPMTVYTIDSNGEAGYADSLSKGYAVSAAVVNPVYMANAAASSNYNPQDDMGVVFLSGSPVTSSYISLSTQQNSAAPISIAGFPCDNYEKFDVAESWKTTGSTRVDTNGNADGIYLSGITPNSGLGTWYVGGSIVFGGVSGSPIFNSYNQQIGIFDGYYPSNPSEQFGTQLNPTTVNWLANTISNYDSSHSITSPGLSISGTWGTASWTLSNSGALTINGGTMGADSLAAGDPMIELQKLITSVTIGGTLAASSANSLYELFSNLPNVTSITGLGKIALPSLSGGYAANSMIANDPKLLSIDLSGFNTSSITNMNSMFNGDNNVASLNVSSFNTSNVVDMSDMFDWDNAVTAITFGSGWNTSNVVNMSSMFNSDNKLISLDLSKFGTAKVTSMSNMFGWDNQLVSITFGSGWNTSSVTDMSSMFYSDNAIKSIDLSHFNTAKVTNMSLMFGWDSSINNLSFPATWNTMDVSNFTSMFSGDGSLTGLNLSQFNISASAQVGGMLNVMNGNNSLAALKQIVIGSGSKLNNSMGLSNPPATSVHPGAWQNIGSGTVTSPKGVIVGSSTNLQSGVIAGTYVWQP